jgi:nucleoside 2-deoxyribosyltransferase
MDYGRVYLAGPITGLSFKESTEWRIKATEELGKVGILAFSPMRKKDYLARKRKLTGWDVTSSPGAMAPVLSSEAGITTRDRFDCTRADLILMNLLGAKKISLGTMVEVGWADANHIPIVLMMEEKGNPHEHPILNRVAAFQVDKLEEGIEVVKAILIP